jgi:NAD(P)H-flavin reductase
MPKLAIIKEKIIESDDTFSLRLSLLGQEKFSFKPGQFNMLGSSGIGEAPFSFSSLNADQKTFIHTIRLAGNVVNHLWRLNKGDKLHIRGPYGNGWPLDKAEGRNVIIVAGGIGMAPLRAVVHHLLQRREKFGKVFLLYGAKTQDDILYKQEIKSWTKDITILLSVDELTGKAPLKVRQGLVTTLFDELDIPLSESITFTCGPPLMMRFVAGGLILDGQSPHDIFVSLERRMKCGIGHCGHCQIGAKYVCKDGPIFCLPDIQRFADTLL